MTPFAPKRWRGDGWDAAPLPPSPDEVPIAIVIDGMSQAVLMATPQDVQDFATGFALTEGLIRAPGDITGFEQVTVETRGMTGIEARLWLKPGLSVDLLTRRRSMIGPVGCGLCGVDSIAAALPDVVVVQGDLRMRPADVGAAMDAMAAGQHLRRDTPAIHGAGFWDGTRALVREDVGRHNALDKLAGALARAGVEGGQGAVVMSSRLSVDLVQKAARIGAPILIGASAPTRLALIWAEAAGITLIARARGGEFDLFTHPQRIVDHASD